MKGINLRSLTGELHHVESEHAAQPVHTIKEVEVKLDFCRGYIKSHFGTFSFESDYFRLPLDAFRNFSFEEVCKLKYSTGTTMDESVTKVFERRPAYEVVRKIQNSMWRWGTSNGTWNEVVDVWNGIRHFTLGLGSDFEVRLDYTTGYNEFGHSKYSRTFIDGVFAFLVYYKRKHVMTIGFSVTEGRRILIQQVQLKQQTGNRWLYKFSGNRIEFVIDLFAKYFPDFALCVIDGRSLTKKTIADYKRGLHQVEKRVEHYRQHAGSDLNQRDVDIRQAEEEASVLRAKLRRLKKDSPRIAELYANCGRYTLGASVVVNHLTHYYVEP